ncbi:N-acyl homoserine lactonase family protein [Alicyclobacillus macrosporangiidus]|uniref:N-acyl homoserine lactonase family protein n=1 Tax=Alicyclobacillus macrosporangiidus TaxID=392015 RepID=UPI0004973D06|nr:N-acyl homoserine lactonase family protein [Alicyclobacillus macrosporangiidus]
MKVYPLQTGYTKVPYGQFYGGLEGWVGLRGVWKFATDKKHFIKVPIHVYLIEHPQHGPIFVDAGIHAEQAREHDRYYRGIARLILDSDEYVLPEDQELPVQLKRLGYECNDIRNLILTHLHEDHVGCLRYFPNATVMVPKVEWDGRHKKLFGLIPLYYQPSMSMVRNWSFIEFSSGGFHSFDSSQDVFGDGTIIMVPTPGHSCGHASLLLNLGEYQLFLAGDSLYTLRHLAVDQVRAITVNAAWLEDYMNSIRRIQKLRRSLPNMVIVPTHDHTEYQYCQ